MRAGRIGSLSIPVTIDRLVELVNEKRRLRGASLLPESNTQDNLKISFNSTDYREDLINIVFLEHLPHDVLIPYPSNAWMGSVLPDNRFTEVHSVNYFQMINGDCELTHAMEDLYRIIKPGGTAHIGVPNFDFILDKIVTATSEAERLRWEHFLFSRNVDERGLFYNQSICNFIRIRNRARFAGFNNVIEDKEYGEENIRYIDMRPEEFDLPTVDESVREKYEEIRKDDSIRRKPCIVRRCKAKAGQQEFARIPSVYCRRHYRKAKTKLAEAQERALCTMVILKKE
jgi:hypothetical protein